MLDYSPLPSREPRRSSPGRGLRGKAASMRKGSALGGSVPSSFSGMPKEELQGLHEGSGLGAPEDAPVTRLHQMSVAQAVAGPVVTTLLFLAVAACGVVFLLPTEAHLDRVTFGSVQASVPVGAALIALGLLGPCICIRACVWWRSPSEAQRMKSASFGDSMLQEMLDGRNIMEHISVYGARNGEAGTVVMLPGAGAPRGTLAPVAALVAERFRVICVDLPGQGSLSAVPYSLARCEMVLTLVVRRAQVGFPGRRVVIVAQGAAAFLASHFALRPSSGRLTAGLVVMGRVPDYVGAARCSCSLDAVYSLPWAAVFANRALKARIAASDWRPAERRVAGQSDFNLAAVPQMRAELKGRPLLHRLREFERNTVFLGPRAWVEEAEELVPVRRVQVRRVRGARDDTLPPVDGSGVESMAAEVSDFVASLPPAHWAMEDEVSDDVSLAISRPSFGRSFAVGTSGTSVSSGGGRHTSSGGGRASSDLGRR